MLSPPCRLACGPSVAYRTYSAKDPIHYLGAQHALDFVGREEFAHQVLPSIGVTSHHRPVFEALGEGGEREEGGDRTEDRRAVARCFDVVGEGGDLGRGFENLRDRPLDLVGCGGEIVLRHAPSEPWSWEISGSLNRSRPCSHRTKSLSSRAIIASAITSVWSTHFKLTSPA
jgi:hypothetical protein